MKTKILMLLIATLFTTTLFAQRPQGERTQRTPEEIAKMSTERMKNQLLLTPEQEKKVYDIYLENAKKRASVDKKVEQAKEERMAEMKRTQDAIKPLLSTEQKAKLERMEQERAKKMGEMGGQKGPKGEKGNKKREKGGNKR